jgi:hypothetical protein
MNLSHFIELVESCPDETLTTYRYGEPEGDDTHTLPERCCLFAVLREHFGIGLWEEAHSLQRSEGKIDSLGLGNKLVNKIIGAVDVREGPLTNTDSIPKERILFRLRKLEHRLIEEKIA